VRFNIGNAKTSRPQEGFIPNPKLKLKLLDQLSEVMRFKHYSLRTERTYREWIKRFILFHGKGHPREMGAVEVGRFLSDLAVHHHVAASTQNQAFNALLFLYRNRGQLRRLSYGEHSLARSLGTRRIIASALLEQPRPPFGAQCDNLIN